MIYAGKSVHKMYRLHKVQRTERENPGQEGQTRDRLALNWAHGLGLVSVIPAWLQWKVMV